MTDDNQKKLDDAKHERARSHGMSEASASSFERDFGGNQWFKTLETEQPKGEKRMVIEAREWIQTFTGRQFFPLAAKLEDIVIEDIAHSLSNLCRFAGHTRIFYSVAEHSVRVSRAAQSYAPPDRPDIGWYLAAWGLLHDAPEAYLVDLPRPLKRSEIGEGYCKAEARLMASICRRFHLDVEEPAEIKRADTVLLMTERRDLLGQSPELWHEDQKTSKEFHPLDERIRPWGSLFAEQQFLLRFFAVRKNARLDERTAA